MFFSYTATSLKFASVALSQINGSGASCSPLSHGAGPCPALRTAATSFFLACAGAIGKANRPSPETRAGLRRHVPPARRAQKRANSHLNNPSTELARLRADCKASWRCGLSAAETLSSRRQFRDENSSEVTKRPRFVMGIPDGRGLLEIDLKCR